MGPIPWAARRPNSVSLCRASMSNGRSYCASLVRDRIGRMDVHSGPGAIGARVRFSGAKRTVIDGPLAETKELVAVFWLWQVKSKEEAIEWVKRCPNPFPGTESEIEIRQVFEAEDFGAEFTPELRKQEERLRAQVVAKK